MGDIKDCIKCSDKDHANNMVPHWCDTYAMCTMCFYELTRADIFKQKGTNFVVVHSHPEWCRETWGWKSEIDEIKEDGGILYGN